MARDAITISLPKAMSRQVAELCKAEQRTRSELFREALRSYLKERLWLEQFQTRMASLPTYTPTKGELEAIRKGREEMRRGEFVTLDELFKNLESKRRQAGGKGRRPRSRGRRRAA